MDLIDWLIERQRIEGLTDEQMAARLTATGAVQISRGHWNYLRLGKHTRAPGIDLANAACLAWPEHRVEIQHAVLPSCLP